MKELKDILLETLPSFYRFQVFVKEEDGLKRTVGMAYLRDGQGMYTLRLWTFINEKFFLLQTKEDPTRYLIMTRELNKSSNSKNKYFWNIVGNAKANTSQTVLELNFDIFEKKIFLNIFPETTSGPRDMNLLQEDLLKAA
jgi:hypothetical protein